METFGDKLFDSVTIARNKLFLQGEMAQLTYQAYEMYVRAIQESKDENIRVVYPIGMYTNNQLMNGEKTYTKYGLIEMYQYAHLTQLPTNGMYQLVTTIEVLLGDILRLVLIQYPNKIPNKRKCDYDIILKSQSIEELKISLINSLMNELNYKSPKEFAEEFHTYTGVNLFESPFYHSYIELKATRDIHIHNNGVANDIYLTKAGAKARVSKAGLLLPVDMLYFLQNYEACLQITEYLEQNLNNIWNSPKYVEFRKNSQPEQEQQQAVDIALEDAEKQKEATSKQKEPIKIKAAVPVKAVVKKEEVNKISIDPYLSKDKNHYHP